MGLSLSVGYLTDVRSHDDEGAIHVTGEFEKLNRALTAARRPQHIEPLEMGFGQGFSCSMWGYSGLHRLRRIAAYVALELPMPSPSDINAAKDPTVERYYNATGQSPGVLSRLFSRRPATIPFNHLMLHSDAEGYYLPQDFADVIFPAEELKIPGGMIGSTNRLLVECKTLATVLEIPDGLEAESDAVMAAAEDPSSGTLKWQRYGIETHSCINLINACKASLNSGAAIVFC